MLNPHPKLTFRRSQISRGFTLVEILVGATLTALIVGGAATTFFVAHRSSLSQGGVGELNALIDSDLASIQEIDRRLSCCTGSPCTADKPTIDAAAASSCLAADGAGKLPGNENYYAPRQPAGSGSDPADTDQMKTFKTACSSGTIASTLQSLLPPLPTATSPASLSRTPTVVDNAANRLEITYTGTISGTTVVNRVVHLIPTAAGWCP